MTTKSYPSQEKANSARAANHKRNPNGYLYCFIIPELGLIKIGCSKNPNRRFKDLESACPFPLKKVFAYYFENVYNIEEAVQDSFKDRHHHKEWYKLSNEELTLFKLDIKIYSHNGLILKRKANA